MIVYVDASALVKCYVSERGSSQTIALIAAAEAVATAVITRAEVAAALARAVRLGAVDPQGGQRARKKFLSDWGGFERIPVTQGLVAQADDLAWSHGLRGYDAVQLAAALAWRDATGREVLLATFDLQLWNAAPQVELQAWPASPTTLAPFLA